MNLILCVYLQAPHFLASIAEDTVFFFNDPVNLTKYLGLESSQARKENLLLPSSRPI